MVGNGLKSPRHHMVDLVVDHNVWFGRSYG